MRIYFFLFHCNSSQNGLNVSDSFDSLTPYTVPSMAILRLHWSTLLRESFGSRQIVRVKSIIMFYTVFTLSLHVIKISVYRFSDLRAVYKSQINQLNNYRVFGTFFDHFGQRLKRILHVNIHLARNFEKRHVVALGYL